MNLVITDKESLLSLMQKRPKQVSLELSQLTEEQKRKFEKELNTKLFNCGCKSGQSYIYYYAPVLIILGVTGLWFEIISLQEFALVFFAAIILTGLIGKFISLKESRREIKRIVSEILLLT